MKKFFYVVLAAYIVCLGFVGCSKNAPAPEITLGNGEPGVAIVMGENKELPISVKAEGKLKEVRFLKKRIDSADEVPFGNSIKKFKNSKNFSTVINLTGTNANFVLVVEALDKKGKSTKAEYVVTVGGGNTAYYSNVRLGFNMLNTVGSSFSAKTGKVYLLADAKKVQSEIDFMFFFGAKNGVTISSPSDRINNQVFNNTSYGVQTWKQRNKTTFVKVNLGFDNASLSDVDSQLNANSKTMVNHLNQGDVVAFKTASGQIGIVKLAEVGSNSASTLNVNVKILN
ncbi:MAG: hypothetical protein LBH34_05225 [Prevotellaceae bacterium]|jgi:hypothetical protein|nr:hypothetical protein [Prevotellaceae bacterium]